MCYLIYYLIISFYFKNSYTAVIYVNQSCYVMFSGTLSENLNISNGVKQGGVIYLLLFCQYIDKLFLNLKHLGLN